MCKKVNRFTLDQTVPTKSFVPEWRQADLFDLFKTIKLLLGTLGYPVFDNLRNKHKNFEVKDEMLYCKNKEIEARG
ncbi:hypothetical protein [Gracilibacillus sp. JCM 18860]|uniref:hypothetical protein n=1 Tax=Gracilibacillus sp. JCM 18860 TaxID=1306159 RepID=UPI000A4BFC60